MLRLRRAVRDEAGFSISELVIVCGLMGFVIAGAFALSYATTEGTRNSEARGVSARETGKPLELAEKYVMQSLAIESADPYRLQYRLDRDISTSDTSERHVLEVTADGHMELTSTQLDAALNPVGAPKTSVLVSHSVNVANGEPLFRFYDADGVEITEMGYVPSKARAVQIGIVVEAGDEEHRDSRRVHLRNRE